jgi:hypothetical protein
MTMRFETKIVRSGPRACVEIPFDPDAVWGAKEKHYVNGSIEEHRIRGVLETNGTPILTLGAAWLRDNADWPDGTPVEVVLSPDGPLVETLAEDLAAAFDAEPEARAFFESIAPFYRNNYVRWIESAKRPETRRHRIAEAMKSLKAGEKR